MSDTKTLNLYQAQFLDCTARYPALIAGVGTGKTMTAIMKAQLLSEKYPGNLGIIIRKEFEDLRDSTCKDYEKYTGIAIPSDKTVKLPNGSQIMFRHGGEIMSSNLKNINLGWFYIEQAEEFETDEQFTFLRDRLRRDNVPLRQGFMISNANGHNWIWKDWINNPKPERIGFQAKTFDNAHNLPKDFIDDLTRMKDESPNHYAQFVDNNHEVQEDGDILIPHQFLERSIKLNLFPEGRKVMAIDVARFGSDRTIFTVIQKANIGWKQTFLRKKKGQDLAVTTGEALDLRKQYRPDIIVVDDVGVGGGVTDNLRQNGIEVRAHKGGEKSSCEDFYNRRSEDYFTLQKLFMNEEIQLIQEQEQMDDLAVIKFSYKGNGKKFVLSKEDLKKGGCRSPDYADALMMAAGQTPRLTAVNYASLRQRQQKLGAMLSSGGRGMW